MSITHEYANQDLFTSSTLIQTRGDKEKTVTLKNAVPRFIHLRVLYSHPQENTHIYQFHHGIEWHQRHPHQCSKGGSQWAQDVVAHTGSKTVVTCWSKTNPESQMMSFNNHMWVQAQVIARYYIWSGRLRAVCTWRTCEQFTHAHSELTYMHVQELCMCTMKT